MEVEGWNKVSYCFKLIKDKDWQLCSQVAQLRQVKTIKNIQESQGRDWILDCNLYWYPKFETLIIHKNLHKILIW